MVILDFTKIAMMAADRGLSYTQLADKAKLNMATVYGARKGRPVRMKTITALAKALGCKPSDLLLMEK